MYMATAVDSGTLIWLVRHKGTHCIWDRTQRCQVLLSVQCAHGLQLSDRTLHSFSRWRLKYTVEKCLGWPQLQQMDLEDQLFQRNPNHFGSLRADTLLQLLGAAFTAGSYLLVLQRSV